MMPAHAFVFTTFNRYLSRDKILLFFYTIKYTYYMHGYFINLVTANLKKKEIMARKKIIKAKTKRKKN